ncbi:MAG: helix-turn-helix domain-containing protein [Acidobacteriia bacterium]|nr:helix-turn-helix domain-containing protein [Terriglobia bacterium]
MSTKNLTETKSDPFRPHPKVEREKAKMGSERRPPAAASTYRTLTDNSSFLQPNPEAKRLQVMPVVSSLVDAREAARFLSCSPRTVKRMAEAGEIPAMRIGNRWRFSLRALEKWCEERLSSRQRNSCPSERSE